MRLQELGRDFTPLCAVSFICLPTLPFLVFSVGFYLPKQHSKLISAVKLVSNTVSNADEVITLFRNDNLSLELHQLGEKTPNGRFMKAQTARF